MYKVHEQSMKRFDIILINIVIFQIMLFGETCHITWKEYNFESNLLGSQFPPVSELVMGIGFLVSAGFG